MNSKRRDRYKVLVYSPKAIRRDTIKRAYLRWREDEKILYRCDNPDCALHTGAANWNGEKLVLVMDHVSGNKHDNRSENLRLLCPNCDSQLPTKGGANKGRVVSIGHNSFTLKSKDGTRQHEIIGSGGFRLGGSAKMEYAPAKKN